MSGTTLKIIAALTMIVDHIGSILFPEEIIFRIIGRIAFPIFCFLLVEGFIHTSNVKKYIGRLFAFAIISEIPFDLAHSRLLLDIHYQNVMWTLLLGVLAMEISQWIYKKMANQKDLYSFLAFVVIGVLAQLTNTDYGLFGILLIYAYYRYREQKVIHTILAGLIYMTMSWLQLAAIVAQIPIWFYNGQKGLGSKIVGRMFYFIYPVHLFILYLIAC